MRLICEFPEGTLRNATTVNDVSAVASAIRQMPGVGKPFLIFQTSPGWVVMADFGLYPQYVVTSDLNQNIALINAMLASPPLDAITLG